MSEQLSDLAGQLDARPGLVDLGVDPSGLHAHVLFALFKCYSRVGRLCIAAFESGSAVTRFNRAVGCSIRIGSGRVMCGVSCQPRF
jgi:hypothetical protein